MSRCYNCWIEPDYESDIKAKDLKEETVKMMHHFCGDITLYGGQSDNEYAEEIAKKLWEIEDRYINFRIQMTYLEDLPYEEYNFDHDEYEEIMEIYEEEELDADNK